jgi:hypothetical protein
MTWRTITRIAKNLYYISEPVGAIEPQFGKATTSMYLVFGQARGVD